MAKADPVAGIAPLLETPALADELLEFRLPMFMLVVAVVGVVVTGADVVVGIGIVLVIGVREVSGSVPVLVPAFVVPEFVPVIGFACVFVDP